ncbi:MAG: hypothetical protein HQK87_07275 [Nitrospinae bacterium]|nr:hypothetical protein [Nitrospinota bacterium]
MATTTIQRQMEMERQLKAGWPVLLMVAAVAAYACVCMIGLVVGMTVVAGG